MCTGLAERERERERDEEKKLAYERENETMINKPGRVFFFFVYQRGTNELN